MSASLNNADDLPAAYLNTNHKLGKIKDSVIKFCGTYSYVSEYLWVSIFKRCYSSDVSGAIMGMYISEPDQYRVA